jgi:hypothetical protein
MKYHVVTPSNKPQNIELMVEMLKSKNVEWHVITDKKSERTFTFNPEYKWIHHYKCPEHPTLKMTKVWERCYWAINWFLETQHIEDEEMYCFLADDDAIEPEYFNKITAAMEKENWGWSSALGSMERGHNIPSTADIAQAYETTKLWAIPKNLKLCLVAQEQIVSKGWIVKKHRFTYEHWGDGQFILDIINNHGVLLVPGATVWFNYFEPGRWNKDN